jgi:hypothetical protein
MKLGYNAENHLGVKHLNQSLTQPSKNDEEFC